MAYSTPLNAKFMVIIAVLVCLQLMCNVCGFKSFFFFWFGMAKKRKNKNKKKTKRKINFNSKSVTVFYYCRDVCV